MPRRFISKHAVLAILDLTDRHKLICIIYAHDSANLWAQQGHVMCSSGALPTVNNLGYTGYVMVEGTIGSLLSRTNDNLCHF